MSPARHAKAQRRTARKKSLYGAAHQTILLVAGKTALQDIAGAASRSPAIAAAIPSYLQSTKKIRPHIRERLPWR
jgi:hypothetical protein